MTDDTLMQYDKYLLQQASEVPEKYFKWLCPQINFLIVSTGRDCKEYVKPCCDSLLKQAAGNWIARAVICVDGITTSKYGDAIIIDPNVINEVYKHKADGWPVMEYVGENGAAKIRYDAIKKHGRKDDVIILLGLDDELLPNALNTIAEQYRAGKWMTYGNWINQHGKGLPADFELDFCETTHANRSYRQVRYRSTAPNTFRIELFNRIPVQDFQLNGKWIDTTTESEVMFSCLEMCGRDRIGVIKEPIYMYNQDLPNGTQRRLGQEYKNSVYAEIIKRPKKAQVFEL